MINQLFTITVTALLGTAGSSDPAVSLDLLTQVLGMLGFTDAAVTASDSDISFTAQIYAGSAFVASRNASYALHLAGHDQIVNIQVDLEENHDVATASELVAAG